jgi:hypothetical protein
MHFAVLQDGEFDVRILDYGDRRAFRHGAFPACTDCFPHEAQFFAGFTLMFQIPSQYSRIERSEENLPMRAAFKMDFFDQLS